MTEQRPTEGWLSTPPFQLHLGVETVEAAEGSSLLSFVFRPEFCNRKGDVHGGILATLSDLAMSQAIRSQPLDIAGVSTISMNINYLEPASGDLIIRGKAIKIGRTIAVAEATCETADGRIAAHATGSFRMIRRKTA